MSKNTNNLEQLTEVETVESVEPTVAVPTDLSTVQTTQVLNATNLKAAISETTYGGTTPAGSNTSIAETTTLNTGGKPSKRDLIWIALGLDTTWEKTKTYLAGQNSQAVISFTKATFFELLPKIVKQVIEDVALVPAYMEELLSSIPSIDVVGAGEYNTTVDYGVVRNLTYNIVPSTNDIYTPVVYEGVNMVSLAKESNIYVSNEMLLNFWVSRDKADNVIGIILKQLEASKKIFMYDFLASTITTFPYQKQIDLSTAVASITTELDIRKFIFKLIQALKPCQWINRDWNLSADCTVASGANPDELRILIPSYFYEKLDIGLFCQLFNQQIAKSRLDAILKPENIIELPNTRFINDKNNNAGVSVTNQGVVLTTASAQYLNDGTNPYIVMYSKGAFKHAIQFNISDKASWINYGLGLYQHRISWVFDLWKYNYRKGCRIKLPATFLTNLVDTSSASSTVINAQKGSTINISSETGIINEE